jgi:hypothetical protein
LRLCGFGRCSGGAVLVGSVRFVGIDFGGFGIFAMTIQLNDSGVGWRTV